MQVPTKADPSTKKQSCKRGAVSAKGAGGINMILALLEGVLGGLQIWSDWLELGGTSPCRILSLSEGSESLSSSGSLYPAEQSGFL